MNKGLIIAGVTAVSVLAGGAAFAKTSLGNVKTPSGTEVAKVGIEGTVSGVSTTGKNQVQVKEADGKTYNVKLGPRWYANTSVKDGENIKVEGVEHSEGDISAWKLTKGDGSEVTLRTEAGKPAWAGQRGHGKGMGQGQGTGFTDANGDGACDHMQNQ